MWRDSVGIEEENSYHTFYKYGNMASAVIPVNLYEAKKGMLKDGDNLLIAPLLIFSSIEKVKGSF